MLTALSPVPGTEEAFNNCCYRKTQPAAGLGRPPPQEALQQGAEEEQEEAEPLPVCPEDLLCPFQGGEGRGPAGVEAGAGQEARMLMGGECMRP